MSLVAFEVIYDYDRLCIAMMVPTPTLCGIQDH